ncbi:hypothetical protein CDEF62S_05627 [Castellaniella defragrans]
MTQDTLTAETIADYLSQNPDFFETYADVFANLSVPHPHQARAISLGERQILTLRTRLRDYELQLRSLLQNAGHNERINLDLIQWCARMLGEADATQIPAHIIRSLGDQFDLNAIALRVWDLPGLTGSEFTEDVTPAIRGFAKDLAHPYCGPLQGQEAASWLGSEPASLAIVPLRTLTDGDPVGLLVMGSDETERFTPDMGTTFLELIATLAGAALGRLATPTPEAA